MRVLITGSSGFIGNNICEFLRRGKHKRKPWVWPTNEIKYSSSLNSRQFACLTSSPFGANFGGSYVTRIYVTVKKRISNNGGFGG